MNAATMPPPAATNMPEDNFEEEKKIGFESYDKHKKIERFQSKLPAPRLRRATKVFLILGGIASIMTTMYFFLPAFSGLLGALAFLIQGIIVLFLVLGSLFIILASSGFRQWLGTSFATIPNFFFDFVNHVAELKVYFPFVAGFAFLFDIIALILAISGHVKKYTYFVTYIVIASIFLGITAIFTILFYVNGGYFYLK